MSGISLVTKGFINPIQAASGGIIRERIERTKPKVLITHVKINNEKKISIDENTIKIKSVKILFD